MFLRLLGGGGGVEPRGSHDPPTPPLDPDMPQVVQAADGMCMTNRRLWER